MKFFKGNLFKKVIAPLVRGGVKQIPIFGTPVAELATNMMTPAGQPKKHSTVSLITQLTLALAILTFAYLDLKYNGGENLKFLIRQAVALFQG